VEQLQRSKVDFKHWVVHSRFDNGAEHISQHSRVTAKYVMLFHHSFEHTHTHIHEKTK